MLKKENKKMKYVGYFFKGAFVSAGCVVGMVAGIVIARDILVVLSKTEKKEPEGEHVE